MQRVNLKPLSVNEAYTGKRYKTQAYKNYKQAMQLMLPKYKLPPPPYEVRFRFGFSNAGADCDNPTKAATDCIAERYGFNDKLIFKFILEKIIVPKGKEFIEFEILHYGKD
jgi:Holliday junction resolvase RusA-like endonuclease